MAAALAIQELAETYDAIPTQRLSTVGQDFVRATKEMVAKSESSNRNLKLTAIRRRTALLDALSKLRAAGAVPDDLGGQFDDAIQTIGKQISDHESFMTSLDEDSRAILEKVKSIDFNSYKIVKKLVARFVEIGKETHSDAVDMYYFLLSLKSEFDPEAKADRTTFDDPDELRAFLESIDS